MSNKATVVAMPSNPQRPLRDVRRAAAHQLRATADLMESDAAVANISHDLLGQIHKELIGSGGTITVETANALATYVDTFGGAR